MKIIDWMRISKNIYIAQNMERSDSGKNELKTINKATSLANKYIEQLS